MIMIMFGWFYVSVLVDVLKAHGKESAAVAEQGYRAIWFLASGSPANRTAFGVVGACDGE